MLQVVAAPFLYFLSRRMLSSALLQIDPMPFIHVLLGAEITYENNSSKFLLTSSLFRSQLIRRFRRTRDHLRSYYIFTRDIHHDQI